MALKRTHSDVSPCNDPPAKRRYISFPHTPSSLFTPQKSTTPYPPHPSDSPTNPFGRKRLRKLIHTLPNPTPFSRHLAFRFQLVRPDISPKLGGVYRIVQVPLSYTFKHLQCLVSFIFDGAPPAIGMDEHLFELKKNLSVYSPLYKPGQIKAGQTWARLSSAKDPCRYRPQYDLDESDDDVDGGEPEEEDAERVAESSDDWRWEDEAEFTLAHAWPSGASAERGIVYHHSRTAQVHITINKSPIPRRKGRGNVPFVFSGRGRVRLSLPSLPRPVFLTPAKKPSPRPSSTNMEKRSPKKPGKAAEIIEISDTDADGDADPEEQQYHAFNSNHPFHAHSVETDIVEEDEGSEEDDDENTDVNLCTKKLNAPDAFAKYLARFMGHSPDLDGFSSSEEELYDHEDFADATPSTPGLTRSSSAPSSPILSSSSPIRSSNISFHLPSSPASNPFLDTSSYPIAKYKYTPAPPKAHRMRIERIQRRMEKLKKKDWICAKDEVLSEEEQDELDEDEPFVMPELKEGEVWDPFGDEIEV